jgi:hypothetical protein
MKKVVIEINESINKRKPLEFNIITRPNVYNIKDCWECISHKGKTTRGYFQIVINGKNMLTHRYMYEKFKGILTKDSIIRHKCDNPSCSNPSHLVQDTLKGNTQDMINKHRDKSNYEKKYFTAKRLADNYKEECNNQHEFARKYNLNSHNINNCLQNRRKSHKGWIFIYNT